MQAILFHKELDIPRSRAYGGGMDHFAANIGVLVERAGGQVALAQHARTTQPTISKWMSGTRPRNIEALRPLADFANVSIEDLLTRRIETVAAQVPMGSVVMLPVSLPSLERLTTMMHGLLNAVGLGEKAAEYAERLALHLPVALADAVAPLEPRSSVVQRPLADTAQPRATDDLAH